MWATQKTRLNDTKDPSEDNGYIDGGDRDLYRVPCLIMFTEQ